MGIDENKFFYVWTKICDRINNVQNLKFIKFILKDLKNETEDSKLNKKLKKYLHDKKEMISENLAETPRVKTRGISRYKLRLPYVLHNVSYSPKT